MWLAVLAVVMLAGPVAAGSCYDHGASKIDRLIQELLTAHDDDDREDAAEDLGKIGGRRALKALEYAAEYDEDRGVRKDARKAAKKIRARLVAAELIDHPDKTIVIDRRPRTVVIHRRPKTVVIHRRPKRVVIHRRPKRVVIHRRPDVRRRAIVRHRLRSRRVVLSRRRATARFRQARHSGLKLSFGLSL